MRLYNASSCTPAVGTSVPQPTIHHYSQPPPQPLHNNNNNNKPAGTRHVRKLQTVWPPPSSFDSDVELTHTQSTLSTSMGTPTRVPRGEASREAHGPEEKDLSMAKSSPQKGETKQETERPRLQASGALAKTPQRKFASAFQSPLRLAKLQFYKSPKNRLLMRRFQSKPSVTSKNGEEARLLNTQKRSSNEASLPCDPIFSSDDGEDETTQLDHAEPIEEENEQPQVEVIHPSPLVRGRHHNTFQSPLRKYQISSKEQLNSPDLSKNETNTTATSETFDGLPGRVSSESFHFDIDLVKSTDEAAAAELDLMAEELPQEHFDPDFECGSSISKSSSSTLTSHWFDEPMMHSNKEEDEIVVENFQRPIAPAPWATSSNGFDSHFEDDDECPVAEPIDVERRRVSDGRAPSSVFDSAWSGETWSDADSWIDFTADPFKSIRRNSLVTKPSPTKLGRPFSSPKLQPQFTPLHKITTPCLVKSKVDTPSSRIMGPKVEQSVRTRTFRQPSPGNTQPNDDKNSPIRRPQSASRRVPILLGPLLQAKYQMSRQLQSSAVEKQVPKETTPEQWHTTSTAEQSPSKLPEKYQKMLKMGLPEGAVRNAMERDGIDPSMLDENAGVAAKLPDVKQAELERYRRFRVHWEVHENVRSNTMWSMLQRDSSRITENIQVDEEEYTRLFQETKDPILKKRLVKRESTGFFGTVIDAKRANNGGIALARIKLSYQEVARAIDFFDYSALSVDQIQALLPYLPTTDEEAKLKDQISKAGGKHMLKSECEKFMATMLSVQNRKQKLEAMLFMKQFPVVIEGLINDSRLVQKACEEVTGSSRLRQLFGVLLEIGNRVNTAGQSGKQKALAIRLNSLVRLNQGKAFDRKTTFLQYVASVLRRSCVENVNIREELPTLRRADKVDLDQMLEDVTKIETRLTDLRQIALHMGGDALSPELEVEVLQSTTVGQFTLDAYLQMASIYKEMEAVKHSYSALLHYFGEETPVYGSKPLAVFGVLSVFLDDFEAAVEHAIARDRATLRSLHSPGRRFSNACNHHSSSPRRSSAEPRSGIGGVLDAIRCKASQSSSFDI